MERERRACAAFRGAADVTTPDGPTAPPAPPRARSTRQSRTPSREQTRPPPGFTLLELLVATVLLAVAAAIGAEGLRRYRDAAALDRAADAVRSRLAEARMLGVTSRAVVRLRMTPTGALELRDPDGELVGSTPLVGGTFDLDSARLRPSVLRFNARGQASPGSLYLYRKRRGVRVVSNFVGRVRVERFSLP